MKYLYKNLGEVDITSLVNFSLLKEYFLVKNLKVKKIVLKNFFRKDGNNGKSKNT